MRRALVEVRKSEQDRCDHQRKSSAHAAFKQILHPAAKEEFFRHRGEEKYQNPSYRRRTDRWKVRVRMDKTERPAQRQDQRGEEQELAQSAFPVIPAQMKVESSFTKLADGLKAIQADIDQKQFVKGPQSGGPRMVEPA